MKKSKLPSLISILVLTLITAVMWISFNIYHALTSAPPASVPEEVSNPLTPTLDKDAIDQIETRLFLNDSQIPETVAAGTPIPTETINPTPTPVSTTSPTATPETTIAPTPTPSG